MQINTRPSVTKIAFITILVIGISIATIGTFLSAQHQQQQKTTLETEKSKVQAIFKEKFGNDTNDVLNYIKENLNLTITDITPLELTFVSSDKSKSMEFQDKSSTSVYTITITNATNEIPKQIFISCAPENSYTMACNSPDGEDY